MPTRQSRKPSQFSWEVKKEVVMGWATSGMNKKLFAQWYSGHHTHSVKVTDTNIRDWIKYAEGHPDLFSEAEREVLKAALNRSWFY